MILRNSDTDTGFTAVPVESVLYTWSIHVEGISGKRKQGLCMTLSAPRLLI